MAIFNRTKKETKTKKVTKEVKAAEPVSTSMQDLAHVLRHARITEKATMMAETSSFVFVVAENATKNDVIKAVKKLYNVTPRKVAIVPIPTKEKRNARTGKFGMKRGGKKAYVYLKKGETINIA